MADQGALDRYAVEVAGQVFGTNLTDDAGNPAQFATFVTEINRRIKIVEAAAARLEQNDANIGTLLIKKAAELYQNDANIGNRILAKLVKAKDDPSGAVYVVTQTSFNHISGAALEAGAALGLWGGFPDVVTLAPEQVAALAEQLGGKLYVAPVVKTPATAT